MEERNSMNYLEQNNLTLDRILDKNILKKVQDRICEIAKIFAFTVDDYGRMLTEMSGTEEEVRLLYGYLGQDAFFHAAGRVSGNSIEDQVVEETIYENVRVAALRVKAQGGPALTWIICAVLNDEEAGESFGYVREIDAANPEQLHKEDDYSAKKLEGIDKKIAQKDLYAVLDLLRMMSKRQLEAKLSRATWEVERYKNISDKETMSMALQRSEVLTNIVQLLGSDDAIELLFVKILKCVGEFMHLSSAQIFRFNKNAETMDVMAEWYNQGFVSIFEKTQNIKRSSLVERERPTVISFDTKCSPLERLMMDDAHVKAMVTFPLMINGQLSMSVSFHECKEDRTWDMEEVRFLNDVVQVIQSILDKRIQKNSLVSSFASLEAVLDHVGCATCVRDKESGRLLFVNKILKATFEKELLDGTLGKIFGTETGNGEETKAEMYHKASERYYDVYTTEVNWVDGRKAILHAAYDITQKKLYQKKIEQLAYTDYLTGLYNRMCCERNLAMEIDYAKKNHKRGAILYLDLDDFKHINDGLGHQYGDVLLKAIAHSVQNINGLHDNCYRMGGDEFVIVIPTDIYPRINFILDEIREIFAKPWFLKDADYYCTMSMGVVEFPDEGDGVQDLIKKADIAMYEAKKSGKNRVAHYSSNFTSESSKRLDMEKNMRDASASNYREFEVYYQPIIDITLPGSPCTGAEALIRWNSQELGFIPPSDFIPLAEYLGLINPIGQYVLEEACQTLKNWNDHGYPNYKINVNLSVIQLLQNDIVEVVEKTIHKYEINPSNLTLEVTESLAINDMRRMKNILGRIKDLGVRIALDDFGTGYSSLNHVREMPLDVIKVDQTFVRDLDEGTYSQAFVRMVSELAQSLELYVCVEGIEREQQLNALKDINVRMIQGYFFGKPMPLADFNKKFAPKVMEEVPQITEKAATRKRTREKK